MKFIIVLKLQKYLVHKSCADKRKRQDNISLVLVRDCINHVNGPLSCGYVKII